MPDSNLRAAALAYAAAGMRIFPCIPGGKTPAIRDNLTLATTDAAQIEAWWAADSERNIGFDPATSGWTIVDVEGHDGGQDAWERLNGREFETPRTFTVQTPSGGRHYYFRGLVKGAVRPFGQDFAIDLRGDGTYAVLPPSVVDGKRYEVVDDSPCADLPQWIVDARAPKAAPVLRAPAEIDQTAAAARAAAHIDGLVRENVVGAIGQGSDALTLRVALELRDLGVEPETARDLLVDRWMPHCLPVGAWDAEWIERKVLNAWAYAGNAEPGVDATEPARRVFGPAVVALEATPAAKKPERFKLLDEAEQDRAREPKWLVPSLIPEDSTVLLYGPSGALKTTFALDLGMCVASGTEICGVKPERTGWVVYATLEGRYGLMRKRRPAWRIAHGVDRPVPFFVSYAPLVRSDDQMQAFGDVVARKAKDMGEPPALIVLDTIAKCMQGMDDSAARDAGIFTAFCDQLLDAFHSPVVAIGHTGKDVERGHRGSEAFRANMGSHFLMTYDRPTKTATLKCQQHKDWDTPERPWLFEAREIAGALVLQDLDQREAAAREREDDPFDARKVGAALRELKAIGEDAAVTTHVLACALTPRLPADTEDAFAEAAARNERSLKALAKTKLPAYGRPLNGRLAWSLC